MNWSKMGEWISDHLGEILTFIGVTILGPFAGWLFGRRQQAAETMSEEAGAAEKYASAAKNLVDGAAEIKELYKERLDSMRSENDEFKKKIEQLEGLIRESQAECNKKIGALEARITELESTLKESQAERAQVMVENAALRREVQELKDKMNGALTNGGK